MSKQVKEIVVKIGCYSDCDFANENFDRCKLNGDVGDLYLLAIPKNCPLRTADYLIKLEVSHDAE